jgi:hypothetical protein
VPRQFLTIDDLIEFLGEGTKYGMLYGQRGQGSGRMPGYGDNPNTPEMGDGMFSDGMLRAVALYEASLGGKIVGGGVPDPEESSAELDPSDEATPGATTTIPQEP